MRVTCGSASGSAHPSDAARTGRDGGRVAYADERVIEQLRLHVRQGRLSQALRARRSGSAACQPCMHTDNTACQRRGAAPSVPVRAGAACMGCSARQPALAGRALQQHVAQHERRACTVFDRQPVACRPAWWSLMRERAGSL